MAISLTTQERRLVCAGACCDPRTVRRFLDQKPIREGSKWRIEQALRNLGIGGQRKRPTELSSAADLNPDHHARAE
jgi:hypothetical protein